MTTGVKTEIVRKKQARLPVAKLKDLPPNDVVGALLRTHGTVEAALRVMRATDWTRHIRVFGRDKMANLFSAKQLLEEQLLEEQYQKACADEIRLAYTQSKILVDALVSAVDAECPGGSRPVDVLWQWSTWGDLEAVAKTQGWRVRKVEAIRDSQMRYTFVHPKSKLVLSARRGMWTWFVDFQIGT